MRAGLAAIAVALLVAPFAAAERQASPRVTVLGDSVAAAIKLVPAAKRIIGKGIDVRLDLEPCRRLAQLSCPYKGTRPTNALEAIRAAGTGVGSVAVVYVGHNDVPGEYAHDLDVTMQALVSAHVDAVLWVPLREDRPGYRSINQAIREAAARWPQLRIADWASASRGRSAWFAADGLHLSAQGATALARFLRTRIGDLVCDAACSHRGPGRQLS
jgi:hypothetical protein